MPYKRGSMNICALPLRCYKKTNIKISKKKKKVLRGCLDLNANII